MRHAILVPFVVLLASVAGCGPGNPGACVDGSPGCQEAPIDDDDDGSATDPIATSTSGLSASSATLSSAGSESDASTTSSDPSTSDASTTGVDPSITTASGSDSGSGTGQNGDTCMANADCESGRCFQSGILGGICSECLNDDHCDWGCSLPQPLATPPVGAMCNEGGLGDGCMSDAACMGALQCGLILDIPGVLSVSTCGECEVDNDCVGAELCSPEIDVTSTGGQRRCVAPGSQTLGDTCDLASSGDAACAGYCGVADIQGLVQIGVCSECTNFTVPNEGCGAAEDCIDPEIDLGTGAVTPGVCA